MFLTSPDERAAIQGSRDPLGVQPVWTHFGRRLVSNLTTVTTSVRGFTTLLLGRYYGAKLVEEGRASESDALGIFLRMEQILAYVRCVGFDVGGEEIRGITRVRAFLAENKNRVSIGTGGDALILSDQRTYGLWGLYTAAARASGLCSEGAVGLEPRGRDIVERYYAPRLKPIEREVERLLLTGGQLHASSRDRFFRALCEALPEKMTERERSAYAAALRDAQFTDDPRAQRRQPVFAEALRVCAEGDSRIGRSTVLAMAKESRAKDETIAWDLDLILRLEALLAPAESLFAYVQANDGQNLEHVASTLREHWGRSVPNLGEPFAETVYAALSSFDSKLAELCRRCDDALRLGDFQTAIEVLIEWNAMVLARRNSAPWVRKAGNSIEVMYRGAEEPLPEAAELPELWRNTYFFDALHAISSKLEAA